MPPLHTSNDDISDNESDIPQHTYEECKEAVPQDLAEAACGPNNLYYPADLHKITYGWNRFKHNSHMAGSWYSSQAHDILFFNEYNIDLTADEISKWIDYTITHPSYYNFCKYILHSRKNANNIQKMGQFAKVFASKTDYVNFISNNMYRTCSSTHCFYCPVHTCEHTHCNIFIQYVKMLPSISFNEWQSITETLIRNQITTTNMLYWMYAQSNDWDYKRRGIPFRFDYIPNDLNQDQLMWMNQLMNVLKGFNVDFCDNKRFILVKTVLNRFLHKSLNQTVY